MDKECNTLPPKEIYDVLSSYELLGGELPKSVEEWWEKETKINETTKEIRTRS